LGVFQGVAERQERPEASIYQAFATDEKGHRWVRFAQMIGDSFDLFSRRFLIFKPGKRLRLALEAQAILLPMLNNGFVWW